MKDIIYIRPLQLSDADESYKWRNNPKIWRLTGSRPDRYITPEIEREWLETVLKRTNERRFAICLSANDRYIGNIYLTNIAESEGHIHIFLGEVEFWGGGRAFMAVKQLMKYAFEEMKLQILKVEINAKNLASLSLAKSMNYQKSREYFDETSQLNLVEMYYSNEMWEVERKAQSV